MDTSAIVDLLQSVDPSQLGMVVAFTFLICGGIFRVLPDFGDGFKWVVSTIVGTVGGYLFITMEPQFSLLFGGIAGIFTTYGVAVFKGAKSE